MHPLIFFRELLRDWRQTGSLVPSSRYLADAMLAPIDFERARTLVEFGPGTGPITREILRRMHVDARLIVFEMNPVFCALLKEIADPRLEIHAGPASSAPQVLGTTTADAIVSGLPLAVLPSAVVEATLAAAVATLAPQGTYVQFQYAPPRSARTYLARFFSHIEETFVLRNIPPARVYYASHPQIRSVYTTNRRS